jgi:hypothetical protein
MLHPKYTSEEIAQRGQAIYDQQIRAHVETTHRGKFLVLNIDTEEYEVDRDELAALQRARAKNPDGAFYILRIGATATYRLGRKQRAKHL